jgi:hypothetical protein
MTATEFQVRRVSVVSTRPFEEVAGNLDAKIEGSARNGGAVTDR